MKKQNQFIAVVTLLILLFPVLKSSAQVLSIKGHSFYLDEKPFDMWGVRVASATQNDDFTNRLIANLDDYHSTGINTISV